MIYFILKNEILKAKKIYSFLDKESKENLLYDIDDLKEEGIKNINFDEFKIWIIGCFDCMNSNHCVIDFMD